MKALYDSNGSIEGYRCSRDSGPVWISGLEDGNSEVNFKAWRELISFNVVGGVVLAGFVVSENLPTVSWDDESH